MGPVTVLAKSQRGDEARALMLDYGYTPDVLINNMGIVGVDVKKIDALIVSHGHFDHFGGLIESSTTVP